MKRIFLMLALFLLLGSILWLALPMIKPPLVESVKRPEESSTRLPMFTLSHVEPLEAWPPDVQFPKIIPPDWQSNTDDPSVVDLLANIEWAEVGKIITTEHGTQQLWDGERLVFEAKRIGKQRSRAADGTIALEAVTGAHPSIEGAEVRGAGHEAKLISSPREIWFVTPTGNKTKVSSPNMDAFSPVIKPDGKIIAFTGRLIDEKGFPSVQRLYVGDPAIGKYRVFAEDAHLDHYQVWAVDWVKNNSVLRVLQDHGETGGHMKLKQVRFE